MNLVQEGLALGIPAPGPGAHQRPSAARIYRMWFGTEGALPTDEDLARKILNAFPREPAAAKINRAHHLLITEALATRGISQVLDIGCGYALPAHRAAATCSSRRTPTTSCSSTGAPRR